MIHVALATDAGYVPYCAVAMLSIFDARGTLDVTVHLLLGDDVSAAACDQLAQLAESAGGAIEVHRIASGDLGPLPSVGRFGPVVWFRLLLPRLLVEQERVLYLDVDVFVAHPLDELWRTDLGDAALGAVRNIIEPVHRTRALALGLEDASEYFNSGVLLLDLEQVRRDDLMGRAGAVASERGGQSLWPDQDALNVAFSRRWRAVHPRWNCMNSLRVWRLWADEAFGADVVAEALAEPAIVHFEGPALSKPWHYLSDDPRRDEYRAALARTPWANLPLADRTVLTRLIGRLPMQWRRPAFGQLFRVRRDLAALRLRRAEQRRSGEKARR